VHSRSNLAHPGNSREKKLWRERFRDATVQTCYGCVTQARDGWEHAPWCEYWNRVESTCSGA
jgi:hypothetical protein